MSEKTPDWVIKLNKVLPDEMTEDQVAATVLMIVSNYVEEPRNAVPLLMSLPLTYFRASGMDLEVLQRAYQAASDGIGALIEREAAEPRH